MNKEYGGIIWTNHALSRLRQRKIKQGEAWATWRRPDSSKYKKKRGVWVYERNFNGERVEVVAKKRDKGKWVILSVWSKHMQPTASHRRDSLFNKIVRKIFRF
jgi:hypothetical protein